jgi:dimethylargininase
MKKPFFNFAITKRPCKNIVHGLTSARLGTPVYEKALRQHQEYVQTLMQLGLTVTVLDADESYPDSTFVEDTAILTPFCAVITNPGAPSRRGEITKVESIANKYYSNIEFIKSPGTLDGGDVMMVVDHFYIGLSGRTNQDGANQFIQILEKYGMTGSCIELNNMLHLKTGVAYLENNNLIAAGEFLHHPEFRQFNILPVEEDELYATNCIWINDVVLIANGFPKTKQIIELAGYRTHALDMSEFRKVDGGLSCLSLRF